MDLRLSPERAELAAQAADTGRSLRPLVESDPEWRRQGMPANGDSREVTRALAEAGWLGVAWSEDHGGRGLGHVDAVLVEEALGHQWLPLSLYLLTSTVGRGIARFGSEELKERILPAVARGETTFCQGFSEPEAGSDFAALTTRATAHGDGFRIDGRKLWTSSAGIADWICLAARTGPEGSRHRGLSVLIVPLDTPGITMRSFPVLGGGTLSEIALEDVEVPAPSLVGALHGGWDVLMHMLDAERASAATVGAVAWVIDALEARISEKDRREAARRPVASLRGELTAARLLSLRAADLLDSGEPAAAAAALARVASGRLAQRIARAGIDLLGLEGLADGDPESPVAGRVAALYRASVGSTIAGGAAEVLELVVARRGLQLA